MKRPSVGECKTIIREKALRAAVWVLGQRGVSFRVVTTLDEARDIASSEVQGLIGEKDLVGAAARMMRAHRFFAEDPALQEVGKSLARELASQASDAFYDRGEDSSLLHLQLAAGLDPENREILWEVIAPCLQGSLPRSREALPYAILIAHCDPKRDEVAYIEKRISEEEAWERERCAGVLEVSGEWRTGGGTSRRTGVAADRIVPPLTVRWRWADVPSPKGGIAVAGDTVVCGQWSRGSSAAVIHGVDLRDGRHLWSYSMTGIVYGTPAIRGDFVYTGSATCAVCLELATGAEVWRVSRGGQPTSIRVATLGCPLCIGHLVAYCDEEIAVYKAESGELVFQQSGSNDPRGSVGPCSDGRSLYLPGGRTIMRINLISGEVEVTAPTNGKVTAGPMLSDGLLIYGSSRSLVEALDEKTLDPVWTFRVEDPLYHQHSGTAVESTPAYDGMRLYVGGPDGNVYALDPRTGTRLWKTQTGAIVDTSPIVSGDRVFVMTGKMGLCAFAAEDGTLQWQHGFGGFASEFPPSPAVSGSILLAGADCLYAFAPASE